MKTSEIVLTLQSAHYHNDFDVA